MAQNNFVITREVVLSSLAAKVIQSDLKTRAFEELFTSFKGWKVTFMFEFSLFIG